MPEPQEGISTAMVMPFVEVVFFMNSKKTKGNTMLTSLCFGPVALVFLYVQLPLKPWAVLMKIFLPTKRKSIYVGAFTTKDIKSWPWALQRYIIWEELPWPHRLKKPF